MSHWRSPWTRSPAAPSCWARLHRRGLPGATGSRLPEQRPPAHHPSEYVHIAGKDKRAWASAVSRSLPVDGAARAAYVKRKAQTAYTQPQIAKDVRRKNAQLIASRGGMSLQEVLEKPIPGGFGYGFIYNYEPREPGSSSRSSAPTGPGGTWKLTPPGGPAASASAAGGR